MFNHLKIDNRGQIDIVAISVPRSLNALNSTVIAELKEYFSNVDCTEKRCIILTGDGEKSFVAGADISEMSTLDATQGEAFGRRGAEVFRIIETLPCPVIAAINGFALGGGCEIAMACDIRICSDNAKFGQPEVGLGIIPGFSGTVRLARLVGQGMAKLLIYSAKTIRADEALRIGLVQEVVPQAELIDRAMAIATQIAANAPLAVQAAKKCINIEYDMPIDEAINTESQYFGRCFETDDQKKGMAAFLAKGKYQYQGK